MLKELITSNPYFTILLSLIPLFALIHKMVSASNSFQVQTLDLLFKCYADSNNPSHKFIVEQVFKKHFKLKLDFDTISFLMSHDKPSFACDLYKRSYKYLCIIDGVISFKDKYSSQKKRNLEKMTKGIKNLFLYGVFFFITISTSYFVYVSFDINIIFETTYHIYNFYIWLFLIMVSIISAIFSFKYLTCNQNIKDGENLIHMYRKSNLIINGYC